MSVLRVYFHESYPWFKEVSLAPARWLYGTMDAFHPLRNIELQPTARITICPIQIFSAKQFQPLFRH